MKSLRPITPAGFVVLALLGACLSMGTASGQGSKGDSGSWDNLNSLTAGQHIYVVMNNVKFYEGTFVALSDNGITLRQGAREQTLGRQDILRVSRKIGQVHLARNTLIGTTLGASSGLAIGLITNHVIWSHVNCTEGPLFGCSGPPNPHWGIILTPIGGVAGAAVGAAVSQRAWHDVYRTR